VMHQPVRNRRTTVSNDQCHFAAQWRWFATAA